MQYVGETENALHIRMNGHQSDITMKMLDKPVATHFNQPDHSLDDLRVMWIEKIEDHNSRSASDNIRTIIEKTESVTYKNSSV